MTIRGRNVITAFFYLTIWKHLGPIWQKLAGIICIRISLCFTLYRLKEEGYALLSRFSIKDKIVALLLIAPSIIGILVFYVAPFTWMVVFSFFDKPVNGSFVGFNNYIDLINNGVYRKALSNTAIFTGISVPLIIILSLILAILLNQRIHFKHTLRTSFIIPLVVPVASVILFLSTFLIITDL